MSFVMHNQVTVGSGTAKGIGAGLSKVASWVIAAKGTGYRHNDVVTLAGGTFRRNAQLRVIDVDAAGAVLTLESVDTGVATTKPSNAVATTGGTGSGLTLTITWSDNAVPDGIARALVSGAADLRLRSDGTAPTSGVGQHVTGNSGPVEVSGPSLNNTQLIGEDGSATAEVTFYSR